MKNFLSSLKVAVFMLAPFFFLTLAPFPAAAVEGTDETSISSSFELNATIMEIHLNEGFMVVAEKKITLPQATQNGHKVWLTEVVNAKGQPISMAYLKRRDRVLVRGTKSASQEMQAEKIALLASNESASEETKQPASQIHQENGVWKN